MTQKFRRASGGRIDRNQPLSFSFNGRQLEGYKGDTLASALLANGVRIVSRSFKYHRPRGIMSAGVEECNALLSVDSGIGYEPAVRAASQRLIDGLLAQSQNCFPSVNFDVGRVLDFTRDLWPAGFYNKTFKWPGWHVYEWAIRRAAGIGHVPKQEDVTRYRHVNVHCDVLVVGAGPTGLACALQEARLGNDVIIVDQDFEAGGSLLFDETLIDGKSADTWLEDTLTELGQFNNVRLMLNATVAGYYDHNVLTVHDRSASRGAGGVETFWKVRPARVTLATGAIEQPLLFGNNDLPGVMLASAMQQYAIRYGVYCGRNTVGVVNNDLAWQSLFALHEAGCEVLAIVDSRTEIRSGLLDAAKERNIVVHSASVPVRARGSACATGIELADENGRRVTIQCRSVAMSGGFSPTVHLYSQAGGRLKYDDELACFLPDGCSQAVDVLGSAAGTFATPDTYNIAPRVAALYRSNAQWVDFQHDVLVSDIELSARENFVSVEHMKRYTTAGMATDQGKTSNLNALSVLANLTNRAPGEVGATTYRPQFMPVTMGAIAGNRRGEFYLPTRRLPAHDWHERHGAVFDNFGLWKRPAYYGKDMNEAIQQEVHAVRNNAGLLDGSPLGKIEVKGPDAAEFLDRIYLNTVPTLKVGKIRYGFMLNENGAIIDDGVFVRLADDHFLINTTSAGADRITAWLEQWHQCEWRDLELTISPVSSQWAVTTIAGPNSRKILETIEGIGDLSTEALPFMSFREGILDGGMAFRLQRVSFTGERSYELSIPAGKSTQTLDRLLAAGQSSGLRPLGIEAVDVLRLEKGFLHIGADTEGTTNPYDTGFGDIVARKKADFIGKRSLLRPNDQRANRRQFVGITTQDPMAEVAQGAHVVCGRGNNRRSEGFVTSAAMSPTVGRRIALGLVENGVSRLGDDIQIFDMGKIIPARITTPCVYDTDGERMRA